MFEGLRGLLPGARGTGHIWETCGGGTGSQLHLGGKSENRPGMKTHLGGRGKGMTRPGRTGAAGWETHLG